MLSFILRWSCFSWYPIQWLWNLLGTPLSSKESVLFITGGYASGTLSSSTEIFSSIAGCSMPSLPSMSRSQNTFLTAESHPFIATCGGRNMDREDSASCLVLDQVNRRWDNSRLGNLTIPRYGGAVVTLNYIGVYIIGGEQNTMEKTSDFLASGKL